jgi:hypothetical protein
MDSDVAVTVKYPMNVVIGYISKKLKWVRFCILYHSRRRVSVRFLYCFLATEFGPATGCVQSRWTRVVL